MEAIRRHCLQHRIVHNETSGYVNDKGHTIARAIILWIMSKTRVDNVADICGHGVIENTFERAGIEKIEESQGERIGILYSM